MKISIVTATYQCATTVGDCLESVAAQTYPDREQIIPPRGRAPPLSAQKLVQGRLRGVPRAEAVDLLVAFDPGKQPGPGIVANLHGVTPWAIPIRKMLDLAIPALGFPTAGSESNR